MKKVYPAKQFARVTLVVMMMIFSLSGLQAHLCHRISGISSYPEPEPYTLEVPCG